MNINNPPSTAATARAMEAQQGNKRNLQSTFDELYTFVKQKMEDTETQDHGTMDDAASFISVSEMRRFLESGLDLLSSNISDFIPPTETQESKRTPQTSGYKSKVRVQDRYQIVGFISSGTYGRVYKAVGHSGQTGEFAIKKFKPDKEGETVQYTGISQSAIREMALCSELSHPNIIHLVEIILEDKCIYMVFEYAEHDLLQIIQHHSQPSRHPIPASAVKSILFQLLNGLLYLHTNWVMHRDLKPANIMVTSKGEVRIGDLGLARLFYKPLHSLFNGDKVVVTIWYRAPELLLGSKHYTPAVDLWAVGCIFAELLSLRPIFKGEEAKMDSKKTVPFQKNQMQKIIEILGMPTKEKWPGLIHQQEYAQLHTLSPTVREGSQGKTGLEAWYWNTLKNTGYQDSPPSANPGPQGLDLLAKLLEYDPTKRLTAEQALQHPYFTANGERVSANCFEGMTTQYPHRRVSQDDNDIRTCSLPGTKRGGLPDDSLTGRPTKRLEK
ncbi:cyclin-dependent protein kinase [Lecanora helva]